MTNSNAAYEANIVDEFHPDYKQPYWYEFFHESCPICGREDVIKERRYTPKPESYDDRHHFSIMSCWCEWQPQISRGVQ